MIDHGKATRCRIVTSEIPVAARALDRFMEVLDCLVDDFDLTVPVELFWVNHATDLFGNFLGGKNFVNALDAISPICLWLFELFLAFFVDLIEQVLATGATVKGDRCIEGNEFAEL